MIDRFRFSAQLLSWQKSVHNTEVGCVRSILVSVRPLTGNDFYLSSKPELPSPRSIARGEDDGKDLGSFTIALEIHPATKPTTEATSKTVVYDAAGDEIAKAEGRKGIGQLRYLPSGPFVTGHLAIPEEAFADVWNDIGNTSPDNISIQIEVSGVSSKALFNTFSATWAVDWGKPSHIPIVAAHIAFSPAPSERVGRFDYKDVPVFDLTASLSEDMIAELNVTSGDLNQLKCRGSAFLHRSFAGKPAVYSAEIEFESYDKWHHRDQRPPRPAGMIGVYNEATNLVTGEPVGPSIYVTLHYNEIDVDRVLSLVTSNADARGIRMQIIGRMDEFIAGKRENPNEGVIDHPDYPINDNTFPVRSWSFSVVKQPLAELVSSINNEPDWFKSGLAEAFAREREEREVAAAEERCAYANTVGQAIADTSKELTRLSVTINERVQSVGGVVSELTSTTKASEASCRRIEDKLNFFGEIVCGGIGLGAAYAAYCIVAADWGFGNWIGYMAGAAAFIAVGGGTWRSFRMRSQP